MLYIYIYILYCIFLNSYVTQNIFEYKMFCQKKNSLISVSVSILGPSCPNHEVKGSTKTIWGPVVNVKKLFLEEIKKIEMSS